MALRTTRRDRFKEMYEREGFQPSSRVRAIRDEARTYTSGRSH